MKRIVTLAFAILVYLSAGASLMSAEKDADWKALAPFKFKFIPRPKEVKTQRGMAPLPADMQAPAGARLRFIQFSSTDSSETGYASLGALWEPDGKEPSNTVALVAMPGSGGNFATDPLGFLARMLAGRGYASLAVQTCQESRCTNTDNFLDSRKDIEAAVLTLKSLGYKKIVLYGHSLGTIQVMFYEATSMDPAVKGLVMTGMFANLPWKSRYILNTEAQYQTLERQALEWFKGGKRSQILSMGMGFTEGKLTPTSAQHVLTYRSMDTALTDGTFWIRRIPVPILMVRDQGDRIIQEFEPQWLVSSAMSSGSLVPSVKFVLLPNPKGPNPRGHNFSDNQAALVETVAKWLNDQGL